MKESSSPSTGPEFRKPTLNEIDKLTRLVMPVGYPWPASGLIGYDMAKLQELKKRTGKAVSQLVHEAVQLLYDTMTAEATQPTGIARPPEKRTKVIQPAQPMVEAYVTAAKRNVQRSLFSDSAADTATCAETDASAD
jgi:hypothetical protein